MTAIWSYTTAPPALFGPAAHSVDDSHSGGPGTRPTGFLPDFLTANLERERRRLADEPPYRNIKVTRRKLNFPQLKTEGRTENGPEDLAKEGGERCYRIWLLLLRALPSSEEQCWPFQPASPAT